MFLQAVGKTQKDVAGIRLLVTMNGSKVSVINLKQSAVNAQIKSTKRLITMPYMTIFQVKVWLDYTLSCRTTPATYWQ